MNHLIRMGDAANPEQAFGVLEQAEILKYGTAKDLYYRGVREDRFKPILLEFEDLASHVFRGRARPPREPGRSSRSGEDGHAEVQRS